MITMQVLGNVGSDPERKTAASNTVYCRFTVASSRKVKGEKVTTWIACTVFDEKKIDFVMNYIRKGTKVFVEGEPSARVYIAPNGDTRPVLDLTLGYGSKIELCSGWPRGDAADRSHADAAITQTETADAVDDDIPW
jgi:single-strand DNA-binding protein